MSGNDSFIPSDENSAFQSHERKRLHYSHGRQSVLSLLNFVLVIMAVLRILCWALVFLLRLRFAPGESIAGILKKRFLLGGETFYYNFVSDDDWNGRS